MPVYKDEKRGTWYCRFRYTDWRGKRIETTKRGFATKRDAKEYEDNAKRDKTTATLTFGELYQLYIDDMQKRLKASTMQMKKELCKLYIVPYFETLQIEKISPPAIRQWQGEILSKKLSSTYTRNIQAQLSAVLNYGVKYYGLARNPVPIAGALGKPHAGEMDFWTVDEFKQFLAHEKIPMYRAAFLALFWCGLRCGELLALTGEDIDFDKKTIRINKSYYALTGNRENVTTPKTAGSIRTVSAPSVVLDAIKEHMNRLYGYDGKTRLFFRNASSLRYQLLTVCKRSGVKPIRIHDLRHSHASYLINKNVPIKLISQRLGHDNIETTLKTYSHLYSSTAATVADMIENDADFEVCGQTAVTDKESG